MRGFKIKKPNRREKLIAGRHAMLMTQVQIAKHLKIKQCTLSKLERGERPSAKLGIKIREFFIRRGIEITAKDLYD